jgi:hypothetical protein
VRVGAPSHLRGHRQASIAALAQQPPDQLLAAPVAVHVGGVEEAHPGVDGGVQRRERILLAHRPPVRAELPAPQPDDPYLTTRATQLSRLHDPDPMTAGPKDAQLPWGGGHGPGPAEWHPGVSPSLSEAPAPPCIALWLTVSPRKSRAGERYSGRTGRG